MAETTERRDPRCDPKQRQKIRCAESPTGWAFVEHFCWNHFVCSCEPCLPPIGKAKEVIHASE